MTSLALLVCLALVCALVSVLALAAALAVLYADAAGNDLFGMLGRCQWRFRKKKGNGSKIQLVRKGKNCKQHFITYLDGYAVPQCLLLGSDAKDYKAWEVCVVKSGSLESLKESRMLCDRKKCRDKYKKHLELD